ncbi:MAG: hypothetical protein DWQ31_09425 [Planctomycetota bacterium]|nr:MAG: hypothetical protein DWQ31_09425 [Planctomycetota bacterium]REJ96530.1 MAG: hypothetical protein DWQ35_04080 [Planctomycetota bacterium]
MTITEKIIEQLEGVGIQTDFCNGSHTLDATVDETHVVCELSALGSLGCAFEHLTVESSKLADATGERVQEIGAALSKQLTYLLEPIAVIEADAEEGMVQLRSEPPHRVEDSRSYYELLVRRGGELRLQRFCKTNGVARRAVPASVTREVFLRLVGDLVAAVE